MSGLLTAASLHGVYPVLDFLYCTALNYDILRH